MSCIFSPQILSRMFFLSRMIRIAGKWIYKSPQKKDSCRFCVFWMYAIMKEMVIRRESSTRHFAATKLSSIWRTTRITTTKSRWRMGVFGSLASPSTIGTRNTTVVENGMCIGRVHVNECSCSKYMSIFDIYDREVMTIPQYCCQSIRSEFEVQNNLTGTFGYVRAMIGFLMSSRSV